MKLPLTTYIAGRKTVKNWDSIRQDLNNFQNSVLWESAFTDYFLVRLQDRYLTPINSIKQDGSYSGEGFSIMTIICSLIEFLETTYQGINYRYVRIGDLPLGQFEYSISGKIFTDFLTKRLPFKNQFSIQTAEEFYTNIRCGLLHEARTNGKWTIRGSSSKQTLIQKTPTEIIVYRDDFYEALIQYINSHYKAELLSSDDMKRAFLRKFDKLCEE